MPNAVRPWLGRDSTLVFILTEIVFGIVTGFVSIILVAFSDFGPSVGILLIIVGTFLPPILLYFRRQKVKRRDAPSDKPFQRELALPSDDNEYSTDVSAALVVSHEIIPENGLRVQDEVLGAGGKASAQTHGNASEGIKPVEEAKSKEFKCPSCSKGISGNANWCPHCGARVNSTDPRQQNVENGNKRKSKSKWLAPLAIAVAVYWVVSTVHTTAVSKFAGTFAVEQLQKKGIDGWGVKAVVVPSFALILPSYDVNVVLDKGTEEKIMTTTINGQCLIDACTISVRGYELFQWQ